MKYNGIGFNSAWVAAQKVEDFMEHEKHHGLSEKQLKEVHKLCKAEEKDSSFPPKDDAEAGISK